MQTGDPTGTGSGGESHWGTPFRDEYDLKGAAKHDSRGVIAMANKGAGTNGFVFAATLLSVSPTGVITGRSFTSRSDRRHTSTTSTLSLEN